MHDRNRIESFHYFLTVLYLVQIIITYHFAIIYNRKIIIKRYYVAREVNEDTLFQAKKYIFFIQKSLYIVCTFHYTM